MNRRARILVAVALAGGPAAGCSRDPLRESGPLPMYQSLAADGARLDAEAARDMISSYRRANGAGTLALDPELQRLAEVEAARMAAAERPGQADAVKFAATRAGFGSPGANLSAGYLTLAEAFSGWRESPAHNAVMLDRGAGRFGIATAYAPGSKYRVYWAMLVAR